MAVVLTVYLSIAIDLPSAMTKSLKIYRIQILPDRTHVYV